MHARIRQFFILFTVAVSLFYLGYRICFTLNLTTTFSAFVSIALICAEAFGITSVVMFALQVWDPREPEQMPVLPGRTVDVFVPTYNEDPAILRATLEACIRLDYPGVRVYLCDDGGTEQRTADPEKGAPARERAAILKSICDELGVHYRTRPKNVHAKAGNLNYAFAETDGEFIIIFDADHAPEPHFVSRLIGYFADEKLGYIQTPHAFYNFDSFQAKLNHKHRQYWEEGALFYGVIQPGRNRWNCPIFAGSAAMFRRKALEEVGYIALETITEDMHTGMRMNSKGWKSLGISERLIIGQAAPDITTFHVQRLRWGEGNLSIIFYDNPLTMKGLTLAQRLCYLGSMIHWSGGVFKLIIYLIPILMMLTGVSPVLEFTWTLFSITFVYILVSLFGVKYASNGYGSIIYGELFAMVNYWTQIRGTMRAIFWRKFQQFVVTSKRGRQSNSIWPFIQPQVFIFALSFLALTWGWGRILIGISDDYFKPMIPSVWLLFHMTLAAMAVRRALTPESGRYSFRHALNVVVRYAPLPGETGPSGIGVTANLNETGAGFVAYQELPAGTRLAFEIAGAGEVVYATGTVIWCRPAGMDRVYGLSAYRVGVQFDPLDGKAFDAISRMTLQYGVPRLYLEYAAGNRHNSLKRAATGAYRRLRRFRVDPTRSYRLPVHLTLTDGRTFDTVTEELTSTMIAVLLPVDVATEAEMDLKMVTPIGPIHGRARIDKVRRERIGAREYTWVRAHFLHLEGDGTSEVQELVSHRAARGLEPALRPEPKPIPVPMRKPILVVLGSALLLIGIQAITYPIIYSNEIFLRDIARSDRPLTDAERERFEAIYQDTVAQNYPSTDRLVLLMSCLPKVNPLDAGDAITVMLAKRDRDNLDLQKAWADVLLRQHDYAGAEARYQQLLARQDAGELSAAEYRELLLAAARSAIHARDPARARVRFTQYLNQYPNDDEARNEFAGFLVTQGNYAEVPTLYEKHPANTDGQLIKMSAYALLGDFNAAEALSREVLAKNPGDTKAERLLADILNRKKNTIQAQQIYERLVAQAGADPSVHVRLGQVYLLQHNFEAALGQFRAAQAAGVRNPEAKQGFIDAAAGAPASVLTPDVKSIVDRIDAEIRATPTSNPVLLARLGWVLERFKEYDRAAAVLERAVALKPDDADLRKQLFGLLVGQGKVTEALTLVPGNRNDPAIRRMMIDGYLRSGDLAAAAGEAATLHAEQPKDPGITRLLADIESWNGQYAESLAHFEQLQKLTPNDPELARRIAEVTLWSGDTEKAVELFAALLEKRFDQPPVWYGFVDAAAGVKKLTAEEYRLAARIARQPAVQASTNPALLTRLAWVFVRENHKEQAIPLLDRVVALKPTQPAEKRELAGILAAAGRPKEALFLFDGIQSLTPEDQLALTNIYSSLKRYDDAEHAIRAYLTAHPGSPTGERLLADVLSWKPDYPAAIAAFRQLLADDPDNRELQVRLAETTLWSGDSEAALTQFARLLTAEPHNRPVLIGFVNAASAADVLSDVQKNLVRKVVAETQFAPDDTALLGRLAWVFHRAGLNDDANRTADAAVALGPTDPQIRKQLGGVLAAIGRFDASVQMYAGLALGPAERLELANLYAAAKNFNAAEDAIRGYLEAKPNDPAGLRLLADILGWNGKYDESLKLYAELLAKQPNDKTLALRIAEVNVWAGRQKQALGPLTTALEKEFDQPRLWPVFLDAASAVPDLSPIQRALAVRIFLKLDWEKWDDAGRLARLGKLLYRVDQTDEATDVLNLARTLRITDPATRRELAWALADTGRAKDGLALFAGIRLDIADRKALAGLYTADGQYREAEAEYRTLLAATPDDLRLALDLGGVLIATKKYTDAVKLYEQLLTHNPENLTLKIQIGQAYLAAAEPERALPLFTQVLQDRFDNPEARIGFVNAAASAKVFTAHQARLARKLAEAPETLKSSDPTYLSRLAWVLIREGVDGPINRMLDRAVAVLPETVPVKREVAGVLAAAGRAREALALFGTDIDKPEDHYELANIYAALKDFQPAIAQVRLFLQAKPESRRATRLLADLLSWSREYDEALILFQKLRKEEPNNPEIPIRIADTTLWASRPDEALRLYTAILANHPDQPKVVPGFVAAAFESSTVPPESLAVADAIRFTLTATREETDGPAGLGGGLVAAAMIARQTEPLTLARLAYVLQRAGQTETVDRLFTRAAAAIQPEQTSLRSEVGTILEVAGHTAAARYLLAGLLFNAEDRYRAARIHAAVKDFAGCIRICRDIVAREPDNTQAERLLADALTWNRQYDEGLALLRKLLQQMPEDPDLPARIAETLVWAERPAEAIDLYAAELKKHWGSPKLARGFFEAGAAAGALTPAQVKLATRLYQEVPLIRAVTDPVFIARLGRVLQLAGLPTEADKELSRAVAMQPVDATARRELAIVLAEAGRSDRALLLLSGAHADPEDFRQVAYILSAVKNFSGAVSAAQKFLDSRPNDPKAKRLLADVLSWKGDYPASLALFEKLREADPANRELAIRIAEVTLWSGEFAQAASAFDKLLATGDEPIVRAGFASAVAALPHPAPEWVDRAEKLAAGLTSEQVAADPLTAGRFAVILTRGKQPHAAVRLADLLVQINPKTTADRRELAGILGLLGKRERALELFAGLDLTPTDRLNLAGLYASAENFDAAEKEYRAILAAQPTNTGAMRRLAELLSWKKDYPQSIELYRSLLKLSPGDPELLTRLAEVQFWAGDYTAAAAGLNQMIAKGKPALPLVATFTAAVANMDPVDPKFEKAVVGLAALPDLRTATDPMFLSNMAWVLHRAGDTPDAKFYVEAALALDLRDPPVRKNLAGVLEVMGRTTEAAALFQGLTLDEGDRFRLAGLYSADKRYALAEEQLQAILTLSPQNPKARRMMADVLSWDGKYAESLKLFRELAIEFPKDPEIPVRIAEVTLWNRQYDQAATLFRELLAQNPNRPALWPNLIDALASAEKFPDASLEIVRTIQDRTQTADEKLVQAMFPAERGITRLPAVFLSRLAWVLQRGGDRNAANAILDRVLARKQLEPEAQRELAGVLSSVGRYREAIALYNTVTLDTADRVRLAELNIAINDFPAAERKLRELIREKPEDVELKVLLGDVLIWTRQYTEALRILAEARQLAPEDPAVLGRYATASVWNKDPETALELLQPLLTRNPDQPKLWQPYLDAVAAVKTVPTEYRKTIETVSARLADDRNSTDSSRYVTMGLALARIGQGEQALRMVAAAVAADPRNQQLRKQYADMLSTMGYYSEAEAQYRQLLRRDRRNPR